MTEVKTNIAEIKIKDSNQRILDILIQGKAVSNEISII